MMDEDYPKEICPERFTVEIKGHPITIPCEWSHPIDKEDQRIVRIIIVIHGVLRNADEYFVNMMNAVDHASAGETALVIAPQFLIEDDISRFGLPEQVPYWDGETGEGWKKGDDSISTNNHPREVTISAFEIVDHLIKHTANHEIFPNLRSMIVAGHSAGGQYVNRYAAGTQIDKALPKSIHVRYIVANPSTYLYFNDERRTDDITNTFSIPQDTPQDYDDYKYGLKNLNRYMKETGIKEIRARYPKKDVVYLLGGEDIREAHLEQTTNAMLQGNHRLERGQVYYHYLKHYFGEGISKTQRIAIIPCVGHDNAAIFKSEAGLKYLFDR